MTYDELVAAKILVADKTGFDYAGELNPLLKDFQETILRWAVNKGRAAIFAGCGMGKTLMQLELARIVADHTGGRVLILTPLAVAPQTVKEAKKFGIHGVKYHENQESADADNTRIVVTNYDRVKDFDASKFDCVHLDESSILKAFTGQTKKYLCETFRNTPYRFCWTATPSPNDHTELGNHSEFLGVMSQSGMLTRWFVHDSENTSEWRLKGHAERDFWRWVCSWAVSVRYPSDIGGCDDGYILPPLNWIEHQVEIEHDGSNGKLLPDAAPSATKLFASMRKSISERVAMAAAIIAENPGEQWCVWCELNDESDAIVKAIPNAVEVKGSMTHAMKEDRLLGFAEGRYPVLVSKASVAGFGMNFQNCRNTIFVGLSYSYEKMYQAVRRHWRFGQSEEVNAHVITTNTESGVLATIKRKGELHDIMQTQMIEATKEHQLAELKRVSMETFGTQKVASGDMWNIVNGDCVKGVQGLADNSIGFSVFSPPFASLYTYSESAADMGNCGSDGEFFDQFKFLIHELHRVTMPGRLVSVHCMDLPSTITREGVIGIRDFPGEIVRAFVEEGFIFHSRVTIWKDPLVAMQRTKAIGLLHKQLCKDSAISRQGIADYVVTFRKIGPNPEPISHGVGFTSYIGEDEPRSTPTSDAATNKYGHEVWQRYASPVWMDINQTNVLPYAGGREEKDERHICPLQLDVIERCIELWSNPGDLVLSPFTGVGSEGYVAVKKGRRFQGFELKESYFNQAKLNIRRAEEESKYKQNDLFSEAL